MFERTLGAQSGATLRIRVENVKVANETYFSQVFVKIVLHWPCTRHHPITPLVLSHNTPLLLPTKLVLYTAL